MRHSSPSKFHARGAHARIPSVAFAVVLVMLALLSTATTAFALDAPDLLDEIHARNTQWRESALGEMTLPLGFQAHFGAQYTWHLYRSDRLAQPFVAEAGPGLLKERALESRFALSRVLTDKIEFEIAWQTRSRIESDDPMSFQSHSVGALIRITP